LGLAQRYQSAISIRVSVTAVITVVRMPRMKTTAKPRTGPEPSEEQRHRRDQHGDVGVDDGGEGALEAGLERRDEERP
jgi:hypothetical protein